MPGRLTLRLDAAELARMEGAENADEPVLALELRKEAGGPDATYKLIVTSGSEHEEFEGLTARKGRNNIVTLVNSASKLIKIEDVGSGLPAG